MKTVARHQNLCGICLPAGQKVLRKVEKSLLLEKCDGTFCTIDEYLEKAKDKHKDKIYYTADKVAQSGYISLFEAEGIEVVVLDRIIDTQFAQTVEMAKENVRFCRVDAELADS